MHCVINALRVYGGEGETLTIAALIVHHSLGRGVIGVEKTGYLIIGFLSFQFHSSGL